MILTSESTIKDFTVDHYTGSPNSNCTIPDAYFSILSTNFWCLKYIFIYARHAHFMIYHHFLTWATYFFTNQFFSKKFFSLIFFFKNFFFHLMIHKLMSKIRFYMDKTMKFYDISWFFDLRYRKYSQISFFQKKIFFWFFFKKIFFWKFSVCNGN